MKVLLKIPVSPFSGYGNDGIGLAQAMIRAGIDVRLQPTVVQAPIPPEVAELLTKPLDTSDELFDLTIVHVDPIQIDVPEHTASRSKMTVAWTMWEFSDFANMKNRSTLRKRLSNFDAVVGYDQVTLEGMSPYYKGPLIKQQGGFDPHGWGPVDRDWDDDHFYFAMIGVLGPRKNPWAAIEAYRDLCWEDPHFADKARLLLKTSAPGLHSKMEDVFPGLRIFYDSWPTELVKRFYQNAHVLLAPSRGEGKNLPALEFMSTGAPVIATNWGGHREWLSDEYAYPLEYELIPMEPGKTTKWADASLEHLKALMKHAFYNRDEVRSKGEKAAAHVPERHSWDAVLSSLMNKLGEQVDGGEDLKKSFEACGKK